MVVDALEGHAVWSATYDEAPNALLELERRTVATWLPPLESKTVADIACGTGRWSRFVEKLGARTVGVDFSRPMLKRAHARLIEGDALHIPLRNNCSDFTICAFAAGYMESPALLIAELSRITRKDGYVLVTDIHPIAIGSGWRRSFRQGGEVFEIENRAHSIDALLASASRCGLALARMDEPVLGEPERRIFRECGQEHRFESVCATPAIFAMLWRRDS